MKKLVLINIIALMAVLSGVTGCQTTAQSVEDAVVQVWNPSEGSLIAFGVSVGDGSQVLTYLNYENYSPGTLEVVWPGHGKYNAYVQAIDPRTGATLLRVKGVTLPVAIVGDADSVKDGQDIYIQGWTAGNYQVFDKSTVTKYPFPQISIPLLFSAVNKKDSPEEDAVDYPGAVLSDGKDRVIGLETTLHTKLSTRITYPLIASADQMPPILDVNRAMAQFQSRVYSGASGLAPINTSNGPALSAIVNIGAIRGYFAGILPNPSDYEKMTAALDKLFTELGNPVRFDDIQMNNGPWYQTLDGILLVVVYPQPVQLRNTYGEFLAQAKWMGIEWGRSQGKVNRLIYGSKPYSVEGGFEIKGDITPLDQAIGNFVLLP